eukprot:TRINITY_DN101892_c0_g1_i1.p1 TRINITY_DN101892_c0_g1~~TRINITY_DN101892_c0_g1_i1.p1  ORF type:complete len:583 (-),score=93.06 TRINITY_DN101892_c0_g1_i1:166-1914(-)
MRIRTWPTGGSSGVVINRDFKLYSKFDDALEDRNAWKFCNYNDNGVGFPRDCGPKRGRGGQWNAIGGRRNGKGKKVAFYIYRDALPTWRLALSNTGMFGSPATNIGQVAFNDLFISSKRRLIKRLCPKCAKGYRSMYYNRISPIGSWNAYTNMAYQWKSQTNVINRDFKLYGNLESALAKRNAWRWCNYNDRGVGFPRDCGKNKARGGQWNAIGGRYNGKGKKVAFYIEDSDWKLGVSNAVIESNPMTNIGGGRFNRNFKRSRTKIIKRLCPSCHKDYREIYYKRISPVGKWNAYVNMVHKWYSNNNVLNKDFKLYSSLEDAFADRNSWKVCNYNDNGVGFPRDCGKRKRVGGQWNAIGGKRNGKGKKVAFFIHMGKPPPKAPKDAPLAPCSVSESRAYPSVCHSITGKASPMFKSNNDNERFHAKLNPYWVLQGYAAGAKPYRPRWNRVTFSAAAKSNDIIVGLFPASHIPDKRNKQFDFIFYGWGNTKCAITYGRHNGRNRLVRKNCKADLSLGKPKVYFVEVQRRNGILKMGTGFHGKNVLASVKVRNGDKRNTLNNLAYFSVTSLNKPVEYYAVDMQR